MEIKNSNEEANDGARAASQCIGGDGHADRGGSGKQGSGETDAVPVAAPLEDVVGRLLDVGADGMDWLALVPSMVGTGGIGSDRRLEDERGEVKVKVRQGRRAYRKLVNGPATSTSSVTATKARALLLAHSPVPVCRLPASL